VSVELALGILCTYRPDVRYAIDNVCCHTPVLAEASMQDGGSTILRAEEDLVIRRSETGMLEDKGYDVLEASWGEEAIATVETQPDVGLVLMNGDPGIGMDATETAQIILKTLDIPTGFPPGCRMSPNGEDPKRPSA
jgi:hypothetical protein